MLLQTPAFRSCGLKIQICIVHFVLGDVRQGTGQVLLGEPKRGQKQALRFLEPRTCVHSGGFLRGGLTFGVEMPRSGEAWMWGWVKCVVHRFIVNRLPRAPRSLLLNGATELAP